MGVMFQKLKGNVVLFLAAHQISQAHLSKQSETYVYSANFLDTAKHESQAAGKSTSTNWGMPIVIDSCFHQHICFARCCVDGIL